MRLENSLENDFCTHGSVLHVREGVYMMCVGVCVCKHMCTHVSVQAHMPARLCAYVMCMSMCVTAFAHVP